MADFKKLTDFLNDNNMFQTATKKVLKYKRVTSSTDEGKNTFYVHTGEPITVVTYVDGVKETSNTCNNGDYIISGVKGEKYVVLAKKLPTLYNLIEEVLVTRQQPRKVVKITKPLLKKVNIKEPVDFTASWGEELTLTAGDFLVKEEEGKYYKIDGDVFKKTYKL
jgi:hypothetical protein